ncbi:MAG: hypothetical protein ACREOF_07115 [Gemmatimonadales bacterium]
MSYQPARSSPGFLGNARRPVVANGMARWSGRRRFPVARLNVPVAQKPGTRRLDQGRGIGRTRLPCHRERAGEHGLIADGDPDGPVN